MTYRHRLMKNIYKYIFAVHLDSRSSLKVLNRNTRNKTLVSLIFNHYLEGDLLPHIKHHQLILTVYLVVDQFCHQHIHKNK